MTTAFDPTSPWGERSPWEIAQPEPQPTAPEVPVTNQPTAVASNQNPFKIGFTLKAAAGYDAEWLTPTVYGSTAQETAERGKDLLLAMKQVGLIDFTAQAAEYTRGQFLGGPKTQAAPATKPTFQNGQMNYGQQQAAPSGPPRPANVPEGWTYKEGTNKNNKPYKAWFPPRGVDASPIWV